jgi:hypothetical protein
MLPEQRTTEEACVQPREKIAMNPVANFLCQSVAYENVPRGDRQHMAEKELGSVESSVGFDRVSYLLRFQ